MPVNDAERRLNVSFLQRKPLSVKKGTGQAGYPPMPAMIRFSSSLEFWFDVPK